MLNTMAKSLDPALARECWQAKLRRARDIGDEPAVPHAMFHLAEIECWSGRWPLARQYADELIEAVEQTGQRRWRALAQYGRALVAAHLGDVATARAAARAGLRLAEQVDDPLASALNLSAWGFLDLSCGDAQAAGTRLARASDLVRRMGMREPARFTFHADQIEAALAVGAVDRAGELLADMQQRAAVSPYPYLLAVTARCQAQVEMARGRFGEAVAATEQALLAHQGMPAPFELARTQLVHGQVLRRARQRRAAEQALRRAEAAFTDLGAVLWTPQATAELSRLGLRHGAPDKLTPTEEQVAHLVADGRGSAEVAAALHISRRTVENHLSRIYRKLGIGSRTELAGGFTSGSQGTGERPSTAR